MGATALASIEELKNTWIAAGQRVSDLQAELNALLVDDSATEDDVKNKNTEVRTAKAKRDVAKEQYDEMTAAAAKQAMNSPKKQLTSGEKDQKAVFLENLKGMINGDPQIRAELRSNLDTNGDGIGLTIPQDIKTAINTLKRQFNALEQYVTVVPVSTLSGSRVIEKLADMTPLQNLDDEDDTINDNDDPNFTTIKYLIQRYAGISTLTNSLLKDTAEQIVAYLTQWLAKKSAFTRNAKILSVLATLPAAQLKTITKIDDIKDVFNTVLDPAIQTTSQYYTNQSGFNVLDKVKDAEGHYVLQPNPVDATQKLLNGKPVIVISDKNLPNGGTLAAPIYPLYIGDLKQAVYLFDREQMSLATTTEGAGAFEKDQTKIRVIDRFDVKLWDDGAVVYTTFTAIADQLPATGGTGE